jgi:hypothetical protein
MAFIKSIFFKLSHQRHEPKDMASLTWKKNIIGDKIVYVRAKTSNTKKSLDPHIIKIEPEIDKILKRYPKKSDFVFPILRKFSPDRRGTGLPNTHRRYEKRGLFLLSVFWQYSFNASYTHARRII